MLKLPTISPGLITPIVLIVLYTLICALIYLSSRFDIRANANDPQIQLSENTAAALAGGTPVDQLTPRLQVDISKSLDPYLIIYDSQGSQIASSAILNNGQLKLPDDILERGKNEGQQRFTWAVAGIRSAAVITPYSTGQDIGYVLVGRSLREAEKREQQLMQLVGGVWITGIGIVALLYSHSLLRFKFKIEQAQRLLKKLQMD